MARVISNTKVRSVFSIDERDRALIQKFSKALGINESQALVLAIQIVNNLAIKVANGNQVGYMNEDGDFIDDSLTNTMLSKYQELELTEGND